MAPPLAARTAVPQYSPSLRVSTITASGLPRRSFTSRQPARIVVVARACPVRSRFGFARFLRHRQPFSRPRIEAAVEHAGVRMAEEFEKPERARRPDAGRVVVDDDRDVVGHTARREQMLDDPEERLQRRRIGVDAADAEEIEMHGARQMVLAVVLGRPQIDEQGRSAIRRARARVAPA